MWFMKTNSPVVKHLVLLGGGHSHLAVLKHLGMKPVPGLAVTLISRDINTPYSGSLPGYISGVYDYDDIHICLLYTSPSPRDRSLSRMPSSA